ncbi:hypothetical protein E2C01_098955 [Portunus trituberculatus]|uniref:Uncharacterized protein n=1 Tax=Portunus trituberculatus TaxID=210409 RepID=A0A5B7K484_PORTR|nr:hypothetical protein [Portunus trituberculatus]
MMPHGAAWSRNRASDTYMTEPLGRGGEVGNLMPPANIPILTSSHSQHARVNHGDANPLLSLLKRCSAQHARNLEDHCSRTTRPTCPADARTHSDPGLAWPTQGRLTKSPYQIPLP